MDVVRFSIENPVKIAVGVILTLLFGLIALTEIPIQLTPDVERPVVTVRTDGPAAARRRSRSRFSSNKRRSSRRCRGSTR